MLQIQKNATKITFFCNNICIYQIIFVILRRNSITNVIEVDAKIIQNFDIRK